MEELKEFLSGLQKQAEGQPVAYILVNLAKGMGQRNMVERITEILEEKGLCSYFGRKRYVLYRPGCTETDIYKLQYQVQAAASLQNDFSGVVAIDFAKAASTPDAGDIKKLADTTRELRCGAVVVFYDARLGERMMRAVRVLQNTLPKEETYVMSESLLTPLAYSDEADRDNGECFTVANTVKEKLKIGAAGLPLYTEGTDIYSDDGEFNALIIGTTGSGKTAYGVKPLIYNLLQNRESILFADRKKDILDMILGMDPKLLKEYDFRIVDFWDLYHSMKYNPLADIYRLWSEGQAEGRKLANERLAALAAALFPDSLDREEAFWYLSARTTFIGAVYVLFEACESEEEIHLFSVYKLISESEEKTLGTQRMLESMRDLLQSDDVSMNLNSFISAPRETLGSIKAVTLNGLSEYVGSEATREFFAKDELRIHELTGDKPEIICISMPDFTSRYDAIAGVLIDQLMKHYIELAEKSEGHKLPVRLNVVLEELGDIGKSISDLHRVVCSARSRNFRIIMVVQSIAQLTMLYGSEKAETILDNTDIKMMFRTNAFSTLEQVSHSLGSKTITTDLGPVTVPLASATELNSLAVGQALITVRGQMKYVTQLTRYDHLFEVRKCKPKKLSGRKAVSGNVRSFNGKAYVREKSRKRIVNEAVSVPEYLQAGSKHTRITDLWDLFED